MDLEIQYKQTKLKEITPKDVFKAAEIDSKWTFTRYSYAVYFRGFSVMNLMYNVYVVMMLQSASF